MRNDNQRKLRALALLSAVTGLTMIGADGASARPPRWPCEDASPNSGSYDGSRCAYEVYPFTTPGANINLPRPSPAPPYSG
jgi:hypothetical protein